MKDQKYYYSEIFYSIQGEGHYTGVPSAWIRFFMCNLQCNGFGQQNPTNPQTYELPFLDFDVSTVQKVEDLPVWDKGCDSSYTWAKKYKHLMGYETSKDLAQKITDILKNEHNPEGLFKHPLSGQEQHLCITGGEPLLRANQKATMGIYSELQRRDNTPRHITFESNGTQKPQEEFISWGQKIKEQTEIFFSVSPKLYTVSGEPLDKAIKPEIVGSYRQISPFGQLKFVLGAQQEQWDEMEEVIKKFRQEGVDWPVWIMPVGAREEEQRHVAGEIATKAFRRGYNVATRAHVYLFGNAIGT